MDSGKAIACGVAAGAPPRPLHEWLRCQKKIDVQAVPLFCMPSTAGTGAEVTPFATIWDKLYKKKYSLASEQCYPVMALLDPRVTCSLPWTETLYTAMDALSHSIETLWNKTATSYTVALARQAAALIFENLPRVEDNPADIKGRAALQEAACMAGLAISQNHSSLAHAMSYPLTLHYGVPHGLACSAFLLPIINFAEKKSGWVTDISPDFLSKIRYILTRYSMAKYINDFCSVDDLLNIVDEMFHKDRVSTFNLVVTKEDVCCFVREAMSN